MDEEHAPLTSNGDNANSERDLSNRAGHGPVRRPVANKGFSGSQPVELRSFLINLLLANPKGMSLKVRYFSKYKGKFRCLQILSLY